MSHQERFTLSLQQHAGQLVNTTYATAIYDEKPNEAGKPVPNNTVRPWGVRRQTWAFQNRAQFNIHPKYKRALLFVRAVHLARPSAYNNAVRVPATELEDAAPPPPTHSDAHVEHDGMDDYTEHTILQHADKDNGTNNILDFSKDWSLVFYMRGAAWDLQNLHTDNKYLPIIKRGNNAIYLRRGSTNMGFYFSINAEANPPTRRGANTWYPILGDSTVGIFYGANDRQLHYWIKTPSMHNQAFQRATVQLSQTEVQNQNNGEPLPNTFTLFKGDRYDEVYLDGGLNDVMISDHELSGAALTGEGGVFSDGTDHTNKEFYEHVTTHLTMGEDVHPLINDSLNNTQGVLHNGTSDDYVPSPDSELVEPVISEEAQLAGTMQRTGVEFTKENCYRTPRFDIDIDSVMPHNLEMAVDSDRVDQVSHNSQRLCTFEARHTNTDIESLLESTTGTSRTPTCIRQIDVQFTGDPLSKGVLVDNPFINGGQFYISFSVPVVHVHGAARTLDSSNNEKLQHVDTECFYTLGPNALDVQEKRDTPIVSDYDLGRVGLEDSEWTVELDVQLVESDSIGAR